MDGILKLNLKSLDTHKLEKKVRDCTASYWKLTAFLFLLCFRHVSVWNRILYAYHAHVHALNGSLKKSKQYGWDCVDNFNFTIWQLTVEFRLLSCSQKIFEICIFTTQITQWNAIISFNIKQNEYIAREWIWMWFMCSSYNAHFRVLVS